MKKALSLLLAVVMTLSLAACGSKNDPAPSGSTTSGTTTTTDTSSSSSSSSDTTTPAATVESSDFTPGAEIEFMFMPSGETTANGIATVTDAVNARLAELGYDFTVKFRTSGVAWSFDDFNMDLQTGSTADIIPAFSWSGDLNYDAGARTGQYLRLDDPNDHLINKFAPDLYTATADGIVDAARVPGPSGTGLYGYIIEKDSVTQLGFIVNKTALEELGFTMADFNADDLASWEPLLAAYKEANPGKYPLNVEAEVWDRALNHIVFYGGTTGPLGLIFNNSNPSSTDEKISSRYESPTYKDFINTMHGYYDAGYVDPDQGNPGDLASTTFANRQTSGDFLITSQVYVPGQENVLAAAATDAQGTTIEMAWAPTWKTPIATTETAMGSGLAVSAGTRFVAEAVTFLGLLATDPVICNLVVAGVEGVNYEVRDGMIFYLDDRAGWAPWRYGIAACATPAIPSGDIDPTGQEFVKMKSFNDGATGFGIGLFDNSSVEAAFSACIAVIDRYAVPLGSGALSPAEYDSFMDELRAVGLQDVLDSAQAQLAEFKGN
ncbi:MAG: ABC transporter substrate-binding protein [Lachnospiraceae bacterium]|nr:ABC transporter substrate-binding protein [Lachnospiraceae bacterium]